MTAPTSSTHRSRLSGTRAGLLSLLSLLTGGMLVLAGCATLPASSTPQVVRTFAPTAPDQPVPTPIPDQEPDLLVRDFLKASAIADQRHLAARQFLTESAAANWNSTTSTTIVMRADLSVLGGRTSDRASYVVRGDKVGGLDSGGIFSVEEGEFDMQIDLVRVDGQWRIDSLPDGVILERADFFSNYARRSLFYLDPSGASVVPDPRWTSSYKEDLAYSLVNMLGDGARPDLAPGVMTKVPDTAAARPPEENDDRTGTTIDFQGLQALSTQATMQFAAQIIWTLADADVPGPYFLERDGTPIDERFAAGWTTADVEEFQPLIDPEPMSLALTPSDGLIEVGGEGSAPVGNPWSELRSGLSAARSPERDLIAAVTGPSEPEDRVGQASGLVLGELTEGPREVMRAGSLTRPTWNPVDGSVWTIADGDRPVRIDPAVSPPDVTTPQMNAPTDMPDEITGFAIGPAGIRVALIAGGRLYIGTLTTSNGETAVGSFRQIGQTFGTSVSSVAWLDAATVVVGRESTDAPVVTISVDGAFTLALSQRNIAPPVASVATSGPNVYVVDRRALLRLDTTAEQDDRYWRDIPGLAAVRAEPVVVG